MNTTVAGWVLLGAGVLGGLGCASASRAPAWTPTAQAPANVVLYLANESSTRSPVELAVYVDGRLTVRRRVASLATATGYREHEVIPLRLSTGVHAVRVVADGHAASAEASVDATSGTTHVSVTYWYEPGSSGDLSIAEKVELVVQDRPFGFC